MSRRLLDSVPGYREIYEEEVKLRTLAFFSVEDPLETTTRYTSFTSLLGTAGLFFLSIILFPLSFILPKWYAALMVKKTEWSRAIISYKPITLDVVPLTPEIHSAIELVLPEYEFSPAMVLFFLWMISEDRQNNNSLSNQRRFIRKYKNIDYKDAVEFITTYLDTSFSDRRIKSNADDMSDRLPETSEAAVYVHRLAKEYGWTIDTIRHMPYRQIFQLWRLILLDNNPEVVFGNRSSDALRELVRRKARGGV